MARAGAAHASRVLVCTLAWPSCLAAPGRACREIPALALVPTAHHVVFMRARVFVRVFVGGCVWLWVRPCAPRSCLAVKSIFILATCMGLSFAIMILSCAFYSNWLATTMRALCLWW